MGNYVTIYRNLEIMVNKNGTAYGKTQPSESLFKFNRLPVK